MNRGKIIVIARRPKDDEAISDEIVSLTSFARNDGVLITPRSLTHYESVPLGREDMGFLELVKKRKSVRKYLARPVPRDAIDRCLEAARLAPSACNSQPWYFIVVDDKKLRNSLTEAVFSGVYSMNSFAKEAPVLIVVVTEHSSYIARLGGYFKGVQYSLLDIGIACEHLILQAAEEGLGTCWLGWFNEAAVKKVLGLPKDKKIDVIISMGYPEEEVRHEKGRKSLDEIRRYSLP